MQLLKVVYFFFFFLIGKSVCDMFRAGFGFRSSALPRARLVRVPGVRLFTPLLLFSFLSEPSRQLQLHTHTRRPCHLSHHRLFSLGSCPCRYVRIAAHLDKQEKYAFVFVFFIFCSFFLLNHSTCSVIDNAHIKTKGTECVMFVLRQPTPYPGLSKKKTLEKVAPTQI